MFNSKDVTKDPEEEEHKEQDDDESEDDEIEKEVTGNWKIVDLPEIQVVTGEEKEEEIARFKSKVYRFRDKEWKQRGIGELRFLKHKVSKLIRIIGRTEKTYRCMINHFLVKKGILGNLEKLQTHENAWSWAGHDISDEVPTIDKFGARFDTKEEFDRFGALFE